jgi:hypothetical protein
MRASVVAFAGAVAFLAGCASRTQPSPAVASTSSRPALSIPTPTVTTIEPPPAAPQPTPDQAASALIDAWKRNDQATARRVATVAAVQALFGRPYASAQPRGCQTPIGETADCSFGLGGTTLLGMRTTSLSSGLWIVESVSFDG